MDKLINYDIKDESLYDGAEEAVTMYIKDYVERITHSGFLGGVLYNIFGNTFYILESEDDITVMDYESYIDALDQFLEKDK